MKHAPTLIRIVPLLGILHISFFSQILHVATPNEVFKLCPEGKAPGETRAKARNTSFREGGEPFIS